ncbi:MAG TPA: J domain-containing protein [Blastocatellia bacterium]|nr:J domain-containing protein [Blastocatellia bacterium]
MVNRDYYRLLGVPLSASAEEIRSAYRKRISVIHPDRFDPERQPEQWQAANEMLMELNSAYDVLNQPGKRAMYNEQMATRAPERAAHEAVRCRFKDLPQATQQRLLVLQRGRSQFFKLQSHSPVNVFRFKTGAPRVAWCAMLSAALLIVVCIPLGRSAGGSLVWGSAILAAVALGSAGYKLVCWYRSPIKDFVYLTPLYYIRTRPGEVTFRWLWSSETLVVKPMTRRLKSRPAGMVLLAFDNRPEKIKLASETFAREVAYALGVWEKLIIDLDSERGHKLMDQLDAFPEISARLGKRPAPEPTAKSGTPAQMHDGSARRGAAAMQQDSFYVKGW